MNPKNLPKVYLHPILKITKSFSDIFKSVSYDFYKIDPMLFAPAKVIISNLDSGKSWVEKPEFISVRRVMDRDRELIIFSDEIGWHTDQLQIGLKFLGIKTRILNLSSTDILIDCTKDNFVTRNFNTNLSCCFVRGIEGGTLEQITRRLAILHQLKFLGILL